MSQTQNVFLCFPLIYCEGRFGDLSYVGLVIKSTKKKHLCKVRGKIYFTEKNKYQPSGDKGSH